jgi:transposase
MRWRKCMSPEEIQEIQELANGGLSIRAIARKLARNVKTIRRVLGRPRQGRSESKLDRFKEKILELDGQELRVPRILREIRELGYQGSRSILQDFLRKHRGPRKAERRVFRRFETGPALESQVDWSPFRLMIAGDERVAHCFSLILAYSRMLFIAFYRNERLPTLLHAHVEAFQYTGGLSRRHVYDNMATVTVGRVGGKPIWNPGFLDFVKHYGFEPWACRKGDPDRKGKIERPFPYIHDDLLKGCRFESWDDLNARARVWLDTVANVRKHETTKRVPAEMFLEEKDLLIRLPPVAFDTGRIEMRKVQLDGYVPLDGSLYPVPASLVGRYVRVRVFPHGVEILDGAGQVAARHPVPDRPMRLPADWGPPRKEEALTRTALEARFLAHFPGGESFLEGILRRMKSLAPIHLRQIERLVDLFGEARVGEALRRATAYKNFNALAVQRILEDAYPDVLPEPPIGPMTRGLSALDALGEVDTGSLRDSGIDSMESTAGGSDGQEE